MRTCLSVCLTLSLIVLQSGCISKSNSLENTLSPKQERVLTVYLNDFDEIIGPMFEEATNYPIKLVQGGGGEIMSRIEAEQGNPHWDVVWLDSIASVHNLGVNGLLYENYVPENTDSLKESFNAFIPEEHWYYPTGAHAAAVIVYNHDEVSAEEAPKSWSDFSNPAFKDGIGVADPAIAAPAFPFVNWFFQQNGMDEGKELMTGWFNNGLSVYPKNPNVAMALLSGEIKTAALQETNAYNLVNEGKPFTIVWPEEGAPAAVRVAAISKDTRNLEAAKAFINFLLDPATQQAIIDTSEDAYHEPSSEGVKTKENRQKDAKLLFADTEWSYQHEAEIKQWFADYSLK